jgi:hypothetical protein
MKNHNFLPLAAGVAIFAWALLGGAGCHGGSEGQRDMMVDDLTAGERPVAMKGEASFLDGKLVATATVSRGFDRGTKGGGRDGKSGPGGRGGRGKKDENVGAFSDSYPTSSSDSEEAQKEAMEDYVRLVLAQRAAGSPMPPVTLRVQLANYGTEPLEVEVTEVNSDLGNFAARPEKLTIAPGASGALDPMISQLGVSSDEIPVKLTVRATGRKETQTIAVKSILPPAAKK